MKARLDDGFDVWHRMSRIEVQPITFTVSACVVVLLVMAWVLTGPLFQWRDGMTERARAKINN